MNCISAPQIDRSRAGALISLCRIALPALVVAACGAPAAELVSTAASVPKADRNYRISYRLTPDPLRQTVEVKLELHQSERLLREMRFDAGRVADVRGDGEILVDGDTLRWHPPAAGGRLRWHATVPHRRSNGGFDAWLDPQWGLFRAEDVIPRAATRTLRGAVADTQMHFTLPRGWSVVTQYRESDNRFHVTAPGRRFAQPSGWIVIGDLGVRRERIAGVRVAVAGPEDQGVRRLDMLALMHWTLPELARVVPKMPPRLTVVSSGEPMWPGGLSAPQSIFIHADRPLISENGTSLLLHEIMHVALDIDAAKDHDWIVEGFAEYYSLELLRRSGTLSEDRYARAISSQREWSDSADGLCGRGSTGARTALAVATLAALDAEVREATAGEANLDDVLREVLAAEAPVDAARLRNAAMRVMSKNPDTLHSDDLDGCRNMAAAVTAAGTSAWTSATTSN